MQETKNQNEKFKVQIRRKSNLDILSFKRKMDFPELINDVSKDENAGIQDVLPLQKIQFDPRIFLTNYWMNRNIDKWKEEIRSLFDLIKLKSKEILILAKETTLIDFLVELLNSNSEDVFKVGIISLNILFLLEDDVLSAKLAKCFSKIQFLTCLLKSLYSSFSINMKANVIWLIGNALSTQFETDQIANFLPIYFNASKKIMRDKINEDKGPISINFFARLMCFWGGILKSISNSRNYDSMISNSSFIKQTIIHIFGVGKKSLSSMTSEIIDSIQSYIKIYSSCKGDYSMNNRIFMEILSCLIDLINCKLNPKEYLALEEIIYGLREHNYLSVDIKKKALKYIFEKFNFDISTYTDDVSSNGFEIFLGVVGFLVSNDFNLIDESTQLTILNSIFHSKCQDNELTFEKTNFSNEYFFNFIFYSDSISLHKRLISSTLAKIEIQLKSDFPGFIIRSLLAIKRLIDIFANIDFEPLLDALMNSLGISDILDELITHENTQIQELATELEPLLSFN